METKNPRPVSWQDNPESFETFVTHAIRTSDKVSVILLLEEISRDTYLLLNPANDSIRNEPTSLLGNLSCIGAAALRFQDKPLWKRWIHTTFDVYMTGFDDRGLRKTREASIEVNSAVMWFELAQYIVAVGALAVRLNNWSAVRQLAARATTDQSSISIGERRGWICHALHEAHNVGLIRGKERKEWERSFVDGTLVRIKRFSFLRPDLPAEEPRTLRSILGFDFLTSVIMLTDDRWINVCPNFVYWDLFNVEEWATQLIRDAEMRRQLFPAGLSDEQLAEAFVKLSGFGMRSSSTSWRANTVREFVQKHSAQ